MHWNIFSTSHGKGPVDGIGEMAKRVHGLHQRSNVWESQRIIVADKCKETNILHIGKEEIEATKLKLEKQFIGVNAITYI